MSTIHGSCVAIDGCGALLRGRSGVGKSDLALRLLDQGAALVADDRVTLTVTGGGLMACSPATIKGLLEVRGVGIVRWPAVAEAPLRLVVDLIDPGEVERLPDPRWVTLMSVRIPLLALAPFEGSTPAKIRLALRTIAADAFGRVPEPIP